MRPKTFAFGVLVLAATEVSAQVAISPELQVNPVHGTYEDVPSAAIASDGRGAIVWNQDAGRNKLARFLDATGAPIEESVRLNDVLDQGFPEGQDLDMAGAGNGFACWGTGGRSRCRTLTSAGEIGAEEFSASSRPEVNGEREFEPRVASFPDGRIIAVWVSGVESSPGGDSTYAIEGHLFDSRGLALGEVFQVAALAELDFTSLSVAALVDDHVLVVWSESGSATGGSGILGQIVSTSGVPVGGVFTVSSSASGEKRLADIEADLSGRSVVVWESIGQDGSATGIYGQRLDRGGARIGSELQVSSNALSDQTKPAVAVDSFGNFVVAFESSQESNELVQDIFIRAYRADGTPRGEQVRANEVILEEQSYPAMALTDSGLVQVAYQSWRNPTGEPFGYNYDILTRRFVLPCEADATTLCLKGGRFQVRALWRDYASRRGTGQAINLTDDSGGFWFFGPGNIELLVKLVDGCDFNDRFWIYAAGLTDVDVDLLVTDTWSGEVELFDNRLGNAFEPVQRIDLFSTCGSVPPTAISALAPTLAAVKLEQPGLPPPFVASVPGGTCTPNGSTLCFDSGRFRVRSLWHDFAGRSGSGEAMPLSDESGYFWFFEPDNLELAVKLVDGCDFNDRFWIYAAGLTNLAVDLTVEDTLQQQIWSRTTHLGEVFPAFLDSAAFATCP
ncbi:MAG: hypothetical protein ABI689_11885 [Thermoanaerobaculia bacterium]